jgi:phosphoribosylformylglycinamidine synthase
MVLSVPPENWPAVKAIFDAEDVEATAIGTFGTENSRLIVRYQGAVVGELAMDFLHDGIPRTKKEAIWRPSVQSIPAPAKVDGGRQAGELKRRLGELNNASKEWIIRQYDHEVQGGSTVKPLTGPRQGPSDAAVVRPRLGSDRGIAVGCGLCPHLAEIDPYWMALHAVDEAIRNVVCVGADPSRTAILDNFCWGNCEDPEVLGSLVRACQACYEAAKAYGTPFISGKDSLNNEFALDPADAERLRDYLQKRSLRLVNNRLRIPSTLLISAIGLVHDAGKCVTADAKASIEGRALEESSLWLLGVPASPWPAFPMKTAAEMHRAVYRLIQDGAVLAAHDFSEDGYAVAIAEMAIGGDVDCEVWSRCCPPVDDPFSPWASGYIVQVTDAKRLESLAKEASFAVHEIGAVFPRETGKLMFAREARSADEFPMFLDDGAVAIDDLREAWRSPLRW